MQVRFQYTLTHDQHLYSLYSQFTRQLLKIRTIVFNNIIILESSEIHFFYFLHLLPSLIIIEHSTYKQIERYQRRDELIMNCTVYLFKYSLNRLFPFLKWDRFKL